jgi:hypothetical protein
MTDWTCGICDRIHDSIPMDIAFGKPDPFFDVPESERKDRVWIDSDHNADLCVIDSTQFYVRSVLPIPVNDGNYQFRFGVWVLVDQDFFVKYIENKEEELRDCVFDAQLATKVPGFKDTRGMKAELKVIRLSDRPLVILSETRHQLGDEQKKGITMERVHQIVEVCMPHLFQRTQDAA